MTRPTLTWLLTLSASTTGFGVDEILAHDHRAALMYARRHFVNSARANGYSYPEIGRTLGRHHTTVMHMAKTPGYVGKKLALAAQ